VTMQPRIQSTEWSRTPGAHGATVWQSACIGRYAFNQQPAGRKRSHID
jgi:hypothetical protein